MYVDKCALAQYIYSVVKTLCTHWHANIVLSTPERMRKKNQKH